MNREDLKAIINAWYGVESEHPWVEYPHHEVFRHKENRKWFAVIMEIPEDKLGLPGTGVVDIVNLKCDPALIGSLRGKQGFLPAYHMNKEKWISVCLNGMVADETIRMLLDMSFDATGVKLKKRRPSEN